MLPQHHHVDAVAMRKTDGISDMHAPARVADRTEERPT